MNQSQNQTFRDSARGMNPDSVQRWSALIGGSALALYGLTRRRPYGLALAAVGGTLAYLGTKSSKQSQPSARSTVTLNCAPEEAYRFWRDFENLPRFMRHLESVTVQSDGTSRWTAIGPRGSKIQWHAEIVKDNPNQSITWRSLPDSDINVDGFVEFKTAPADRGTQVTAETHFRGAASILGQKLARAIGKSPKFLMTQDLRRFKALVETGEIPTIEGQSHGPRDAATAAFRMANPDQPSRRKSQTKEVFDSMRRTA